MAWQISIGGLIENHSIQLLAPTGVWTTDQNGILGVVGSSIICIDLIVQRIPSKRKFRIQDSDAFLSASLSLSSGVMVGSVKICLHQCPG